MANKKSRYKKALKTVLPASVMISSIGPSANNSPLPPNSVVTENIVDGAVTSSKLADHSVGTEKLDVPWLLAADTTSLAESLSKLRMNGGGVLVLQKGTYVINQNTTIDANITLHFMQGAKFSVPKDRTLMIHGRIEAGFSEIFTGEGVVSGNLQEQEFIPQWFGAIADGIHDDTWAVQAAVNAAGALGGTVIFPAGTYNISRLDLRSHVKLTGKKGAVLKSSSGSQDFTMNAMGITNFAIEDLEGAFNFNIMSSSDFEIRDIKVTGNSGTWYVYESSDGSFINNRIENTKNTTERIIYINKSASILVRGNRIKNQTLFNNVGPNLNIGINVSSSKYCQVMYNHVENVGGQGILFDTNIGINNPDERKNYNHIAFGNVVIGNGQEGITAFSSNQYETYDITISNNITVNNRYDGIELWGVRQCIVESNNVSAPDMKEYSFGAINIFASKDIIVNGNSIDDVPNSGIATAHGTQYPEPYSTNIIITNNKIRNWNNLDLNPAVNHDQNVGINLFGSLYSVVQGNFIWDTKQGRRYPVKAISVVQGRHLIRGNVNPGNLLIDDHLEADQTWTGSQIGERIPMLRMSQLPGDINNGNMSGIDSGSIWYNHVKNALYYKGYVKTMIAPIVIDETSTSGYPAADVTPGYFHYQARTGKLFYRGNPKNSNRKYSEVVMKDKFMNLKQSAGVSKTPEEGDTYYDTILKKPVYYDGLSWRDYTGAIVRVRP
ncbi:right-handed parallel beta-helix repeat-containing protein [Paenibacillus faecalis]|uniref:right-handed parallel beta-helix repeat-containing protein n=1 Tax=Paenibacillus faecalis TaxID=2079532 RepID=UPI000D10EEAD|nr:right-handed parallel beta-helix repeat-containing protein [Paenibacillus faecalis]